MSGFLQDLDKYVHSKSWTQNKSSQLLSDSIRDVSLNELGDAYEYLSEEMLWNDFLVRIFKKALRDIIENESTFSLMTVWRSIKSWEKDPYVRIHIGFDDSYILMDKDEIIYEEDPVAQFQLISNDTFSDEDTKKIINYTESPNPIAVVRVTNKDIRIVEVGGVMVEPSAKGREVPLLVYRTAELEKVYILLDGIESGTYPKIVAPIVTIKDVDLPDPTSAMNNGAMWDRIHITAFKTKDPNRFERWVRQVAENLPCSACKFHMVDYIEEHPVSESESPFYWSWEFHNEVNKRLGKWEVPYEQAYERYSALV